MHVTSGNPSVAAHGSRPAARWAPQTFLGFWRARAPQLWHHARYQPGEVVALVRRCRRAAATLAYTRKARDSADTYGLVRPRAGSGVRVVEQGEATAPCHSGRVRRRVCAGHGGPPAAPALGALGVQSAASHPDDDDRKERVTCNRAVATKIKKISAGDTPLGRWGLRLPKSTF